MSEAFLSSLPRFDGDGARPSSSQLRILLGQQPVDDDKTGQASGTPRAPVSSDPEPDITDEAEITPGRAPEFAEIEIMLSAMSGSNGSRVNMRFASRRQSPRNCFRNFRGFSLRMK